MLVEETERVLMVQVRGKEMQKHCADGHAGRGALVAADLVDCDIISAISANLPASFLPSLGRVPRAPSSARGSSHGSPATHTPPHSNQWTFPLPYPLALINLGHHQRHHRHHPAIDSIDSSR